MKRLTQTFEENGVKFACLPECKNGCIYGLSRAQSGCRCHNFAKILERLSAFEDILGDDYDLDRLRELVESDRDERVVVLPVKPGGKVRPKQRPYREPEIVDCVTIYAGGRITYGFHQIGMRNEWVDRWEEEESVAYIPDTCSAELKGGQNG